MQRSSALLFLILMSLTGKTFAYTAKEGNVWATLGPFFHQTHFESSNTGATSPTLGGIALIANGDISDVGSLEIGLFQMNKIFERDENRMYLTEETSMMYVTMGYRRWLNSDFSVAAAFYSSYTMGEPVILHSDFPSGQEPTTSAHDTTDYGLDFSIQGELLETERFAIIADARYSYCLTPKVSEKADHYGILIGLRYFVQEKQVRTKSPEQN